VAVALAFVLTSHYLEEIEAVARRVVVIGGGRVLADDTVAAVRGLVGIRRVSLTSGTDIPPLDGLVSQERVGDRRQAA
jgi:ABC-2 type transport system ATP-binding protein